MNAAIVALLCAAIFIVAQRLYGRFLSKRVFVVDERATTPAHALRDDLDYVPAPPPVLFGHHFASIAGLGPIIGPAIAVIWGWVPALIWMVLATIFIGAVHDMGSLIVSVRHNAYSVGDIAKQVISSRARVLFLAFIFFALSLAMGVFVFFIAKLFAPPPEGGWSVPQAVFPSVALIVLAVTIGLLRQIYKVNLTILTVVGFVLMMIAVVIGVYMPVTSFFGITLTQSRWSYILLAYAFIASVLPVWLLLQPRDYLNAFQLYLGMGLLFLGILVWHPSISAPAFNRNVPDPKPIFPLLFITVACGAISGFHSLVSSGTTAKQLDKEPHALPIAYGAMLAEGMLAVIALLVCSAALGGYADWVKHYPSHQYAGNHGLLNFVAGASAVLAHLGIPSETAKVFVATVAVSFALTTLDSATRLLRYNVEELSRSVGLKILANRYASCLIAVAAIGFFALLRVKGKPVGLLLWQLFGASNQLLAALALLTITLYLHMTGRPAIFTGLPMVLVTFITGAALLLNLVNFWRDQNWVLFVVDACLLALAIWLIGEAIATVMKRSTAQRKALIAHEGRD